VGTSGGHQWGLQTGHGQELWGQNDRVISRFFISGTMTGGERFELAVTAIFGIREGQVAEAHLYFDPSSAVRAK
jgi:ketosteroid isomerase-like protein